jgi:hypothetical protein
MGMVEEPRDILEERDLRSVVWGLIGRERGWKVLGGVGVGMEWMKVESLDEDNAHVVQVRSKRNEKMK